MILEEATKEAFGYYIRELTLRSGKPIIASCELCGKFRILPKHEYHTFCNSCSKKGKLHPNSGKHISESHKIRLSAIAKLRTDKKSSNWKGGPVKCICAFCGKEFELEKENII